jgi:hypothetical protein
MEVCERNHPAIRPALLDRESDHTAFTDGIAAHLIRPWPDLFLWFACGSIWDVSMPWRRAGRPAAALLNLPTRSLCLKTDWICRVHLFSALPRFRSGPADGGNDADDPLLGEPQVVSLSNHRDPADVDGADEDGSGLASPTTWPPPAPPHRAAGRADVAVWFCWRYRIVNGGVAAMTPSASRLRQN